MLSRAARRMVRGFDALVRRLSGIQEFSQDEGCILRLELGRCHHTVHLSDGTVLHPGEPILKLHLWNERIPPMPAGGPTLAWGARFVHRLDDSLELLAAYLRGAPALADIRALHGNLAIPGGEDQARWERTLRRIGFDVIYPEQTYWRIFTDFWENLYVWAIIWTFSPATLRRRKLLRLRRCQLWLPWGRLG